MPDLTEEIALLETRIADLVTRLDSGESGERWKRACELYTQVMKSRADDDQRAMLAHLNELGTVLKAGNSDWRTWAEIEDLIMKKVQAVEAQQHLASEDP